MPDLTSRELEWLISAVEDFISEAEFYREARTNEGFDRRELEAGVARAAGRAQRATEVADHYQVFTPPPVVGGRSFTYDPISNWNQDIDPFLDSLDVAIESAHQIRGILEAKAAKARAEEHSVVGRIARVIGLPGRVRKHLADRGLSSAAQQTGFILTIGVQVIATVVGGLILLWLGSWISEAFS